VKTDWTNMSYGKTVSRLPFVVPPDLYFSVKYDISLVVFNQIRENTRAQSLLIFRHIFQELNND
jgi:hypothetical protein